VRFFSKYLHPLDAKMQENIRNLSNMRHMHTCATHMQQMVTIMWSHNPTYLRRVCKDYLTDHGTWKSKKKRKICGHICGNMCSCPRPIFQLCHTSSSPSSSYTVSIHVLMVCPLVLSYRTSQTAVMYCKQYNTIRNIYNAHKVEEG